MPSTTRAERLRRMAAFVARDKRYIDIAVAFERHDHGGARGVASGELSRVYGGVLDTWSRSYTDDAPQDPVVLPASALQLDYIADQSAHVLGVGARGGGKSEAAGAKGTSLAADRPNAAGQIVAPSFRLSRVMWGKMIALLPAHWIYQIRRADREILLRNGVCVRFMSSDNPDSLRGWGGGWSLHDESQDQPDEALDIAWLSLRESAHPQLAEAGTAKNGVFRDRYDKLTEIARITPSDAGIHHFPAPANPFISQATNDFARRNMDSRTYRQEVLAEWAGLSDAVYDTFDRQQNCHPWGRRKLVLQKHYGDWVGLGHDITEQVLYQRFRGRYDVVVGVDFNYSPMVATVYRLAATPPGHPDAAWLVDEVVLDEQADAARLGLELSRRGYPDALIVADAADARAKSYYRQLRSAGHKVVTPSKNNRNPDVADRVAALSAKIRNADGVPSWFVDAEKAPRTAQAIERQVLHNGKPDKSSGHDHFCDAAGYPVAKLYPAAAARLVRGRYAV